MSTSIALNIFSILRRYFDHEKAIEIFREIEPIIEEMIEEKRLKVKTDKAE